MRKKEDLAPEEKPSFLIKDALEALELVEADEKFKADMLWFCAIDPNEQGDNRCFACLGGASHLKRMGLIGKPFEELRKYVDSRGSFTGIERALDCVRRGDAAGMLYYLKLDYDSAEVGALTRDITPYNIDPATFKLEIQEIANDLRALGW